MYNDADKARIETCIEHIDAIETYAENILVPEDFLKPHNHMAFDATLMRLQSLGETLKVLDKKNPAFKEDLKYDQLNNVIRFRDFISHHYDKVGHVDILNLVRVHLPQLRTSLDNLLKKIQ